MHHAVRYIGLAIGIFGSVAWISAIIASADDRLGNDDVASSFEQQVAPILLKHCIECHKSNQPSGGLDLTTAAGLEAGGDDGRVIDRQSPAASRLLERVRAGEMPPEKNGKPQPLADSQQRLLTEWIQQGAKWPKDRTLDPFERSTEKRAGRDWWSLQPIKRPKVMDDEAASVSAMTRQSAEHGPRERNRLPHFESELNVLWRSRLERESRDLQPAPMASRPVLIRRLSFDLLGLPPDSSSIEQFVSDVRPDAIERLVDRYLASPRFGERWARYWLDVVRYAETNGYERDAIKPHAWRYRDWVVSSFNDDKPYDRFVIEQLAGDELADRTESTVIATGFIRLGTWDDEPNDPVEYQYDRLEDMVHATTTAFLGMTVKCARCHDHKFDPIPQQDYYRIAAAFWAGPVAHRKREWNGGPTAAELGFDVLGWTDLSSRPTDLRLLTKGDVHRPADVVAPGALASVQGLPSDFTAAPEGAKTSQRRLQLAQWIVDRRNPLTARVMVNRLWQHLLGEGLVRWPDNLGFQGQEPANPELIDYLSSELQESGWQIKRTIRQIVLSEAYQQSSVHSQAEQWSVIDPTNRLFWRANRRRMDAEALRDSILAVTGQIDFRMGGESYRETIQADALEGLSMKGGAYSASPADESKRRSVYMFIKRSLAVPLMTVFDCCDTTTPAGRRDVSIVPTQALTLLNNPAVMSESRALAERLVLNNRVPTDRVVALWRSVLGRAPGEHEIQAALAHIESSASFGSSENDAWTSLCHVLINTNEFVFVD